MATGDAPLTIQAYRVRSDWAETITWQDHLGLTVDSAFAASVSVPVTLGWYAWDVTAALQAWSDQRDTNTFSLLLRSDVSSGQHYRGFWSKDCSVVDLRPYLEIAHDLPMVTPTNTPTATCTATYTPSPTPTSTPTPTGVWAAWREPNNTILLPPSGSVDVVFEYHNAPPATDLSATLTGAAVFQNGKSQLTDSVHGSGSYILTLKADSSANPGDPLYLTVKLGGVTIKPDPRSGRIAADVLSAGHPRTQLAISGGTHADVDQNTDHYL